MLRYPDAQPNIAATRDLNPLEAIDVERVLAALRRQLWLIIMFAVLGSGLGIAYVMSVVPLYTASADILIDKRQPRAVADMSDPKDALQSDAEMGSQVELLLSDHLAREVVTRLNLTENVVFNSENTSMVSLLRDLVGQVVDRIKSLVSPTILSESDVADTEEERIRTAAGNLRGSVTAERVEGSYVIRVSYESADAALGAAIANAYGAAYLDDQLQAKYDATRRASKWLQSRIVELKQQSYAADLAVQKYRNDKGLLSTGNQLVSEQQLGEINAQLISAEASSAEAKARLDHIKGIITSGRTDAVVNDALASTLIIGLRTKYLEASRLESEITRKLGADHSQSRRLREEMLEYSRLIFSELGRIAESYESDYNVSLRKVQSLRESLARVTGVSETANTSSVELRELEREAETFRTLYNTFLQRYQETVQQESFPISDSRVITQAEISGVPSFPNVRLMIALATVLGTGIGIGAGAFREYRDRFFRVGTQVNAELGLEYLGSLARVSPGAGSKGTEPRGGVPPLWTPLSLHDYVLGHPFSAFSETLRNVKVAADNALGQNGSKVIGVISSLPGEGKTVVSANLAMIIAMQGGRVLLIDGDLRNPGLSRSLRKLNTQGLAEAVRDEIAPESILQWKGTMAVLSAGSGRRIAHSSDLLASPGMDQLLGKMRQEFDYIIVDLPPVGPVVDAKAFANRVDAFVCVIEWGRTSRSLVRNLMSASPMISERCVGVIFNKEDESKARFYRSHDSSDYYHDKYRDYYRGDKNGSL